MKTKPKLPTCPACRDELVPVRQERVTWETWATRWHCRRCGREILVPVIHVEDEETACDE